MKGKKRISLLAVLVCMFALVFSLALMSACGDGSGSVTKETADGGTWYYGVSAPAATLGTEGDYYLDTETLASYVKTGTNWRAAEKDEAGTWFYGENAPLDTVGTEGDFYLNLKTGALYHKSSAGWGDSILTLKGEQGEKGRDGVIWFSGNGNPNTLEDKTVLTGSIVGDFYLDKDTFEVYQKTSATEWERLGSIKGRGTTWFDGTLTPEKADLKDVYEGDYYYRTFIDDEAKAKKYQIYRFENKAWTLKADVITADLSALYSPDGESYFNDSGDTVVLENSDKTATEVTIPGSYNGKSVEIGANAFKNNTNLQSVTIEEGVTKIGDNAFNGCSNLESANIPDTVTFLGDRAFYSCRSLEEVNIPDSITSIGKYVFYGCSKIEEIEIPNTIISIGESAFYLCSALKEVTIPASVTELGSSAFRSCGGLTSVTFAEGCALTKINENTFQSCNKLRSIDIPDSVTVIDSNAFKNCSRLESVHLPDNLKTIEKSAFESCRSLKTITIPQSVTTISTIAFKDCYRLVEIINHSTLTLQKGSTSNGYIAEHALGIETAPDAQSKIVLDNDFYYYMGEEGTYMVDYVGSEANLTLPETAPGGKPYTINGRAFLANTVVSTLTIPRNMTEIPDEAFTSCTYLKGITFLGDITSIGANAFSGCTGLSEITISESVTTIGDMAFYGCFKLEHVEIPATVTSIGDLAFSYVKTITYTGTRAQWEALEPTKLLGHNTDHVAESSWQRCTVTITGETEPVELKYVGGQLQS